MMESKIEGNKMEGNNMNIEEMEKTDNLIEGVITAKDEIMLEERVEYGKKKMSYIVKVYSNLSMEEKNIKNYEQKLNDIVFSKCSEVMPYVVEHRLFSVPNYRLNREKMCREDVIDNLKSLRKSFNFFKKKEIESIDADFMIQLEEKEIYKDKLKKIINDINKKIKQFIEIMESEFADYDSDLSNKVEVIPFDFQEDVVYAKQVNQVLKDRFMEFIN